MLFLATVVFISPTVATAPVSDDADDPAIWRNRRHPERSLVFGTNKVSLPKGAIYAFDLNGKVKQIVSNIGRPNNIDVLYDLPTPSGLIDILIATEREASQLRVFRIDSNSGNLSDITGQTKVQPQDATTPGAPMGIVAFHRTGSSFAVVSPKVGPKDRHLERYLLKYNSASQRVDAAFVDRFGPFSGKKEIESLAYDPVGSTVWYSDETFGTRRWSLTTGAGTDTLNQDFVGDHEGLDLWLGQGGNGYLVCTEQLPVKTRYRVFDRKSSRPLGDFTVGADETDGITIESRSLGPKFPRGLMVVMDSSRKRFLYVDWRKVESALHLSEFPAQPLNR